MGNVRIGWVALLALIAAVSGWWLWSRQDGPDVSVLTGPPRSDYSLDDFQLVALDTDGNEAFSVRGPRLSRHPFLETLDLDSPRFEFPDDKGGRWQAKSGHAWIAADGKQVRLYDDYLIAGPPAKTSAGERLTMLGPDIRVFPDTNVAETDDDVTIRDSGSILRGHGMRAELDDRHVVLNQMNGRFETIQRER